MVAATAGQHPPAGVQEYLEARVGQVAAPPVEVGVLDDQYAAVGDRGPHPAQQAHRRVQVLQQEPRVHQVVAAEFVPVPSTTDPELDVAHASLAGRLPGQAQLDLVSVDAHDRAARRD